MISAARMFLFQSTLPRGERLLPCCKTLCLSHFNPRSHEGSDARCGYRSFRDGRYFNPRSHEGSDGNRSRAWSKIQRFQSTLPRGERRITIHIFGDQLQDFNPRSHEGSDITNTSFILILMAISIHAPTRGATKSCGGVPRIKAISIHAPTRGATEEECAEIEEWVISIHAPTRGATGVSHLIEIANLFQSTLPRGERRIVPSISPYPYRISIHAPTRGATGYKPRPCAIKGHFNPRSHEGSDRTLL